MKTLRIDILAFEGCMGMEVFGLCDTLLLANRVSHALHGAATPAPFHVNVVSIAGGDIRAAGGLGMATRRATRTLPDLLIVPGMDVGDRTGCLRPLTRLAPEIARLALTFRKGVPVAATCVGAFLLGEAGLLDGRRATTSWLFAADLAQRFPATTLDASAMLVEDGGVTTTGSFSAAFDLALHLIRQHTSAKVLRAVARMGLIDAGRVSQAPYVDTRMLTRAEGGFARQVMAWLDQRLAAPYDLDAIAAAFHVSPRTLLRRFKLEAGRAPLAYLQQTRIGKAKLLLESGERSLAQVTEMVGYADVATFGALFKREVGQTPAQYRRQFRTGGQAP
ncbi:MAG: GlxA family transcriptional regulator [Massilia sp.]